MLKSSLYKKGASNLFNQNGFFSFNYYSISNVLNGTFIGNRKGTNESSKIKKEQLRKTKQQTETLLN